MEILNTIINTLKAAFGSKKFFYAIGTLFILFFSD